MDIPFDWQIMADGEATRQETRALRAIANFSPDTVDLLGTLAQLQTLAAAVENQPLTSEQIDSLIAAFEPFAPDANMPSTTQKSDDMASQTRWLLTLCYVTLLQHRKLPGNLLLTTYTLAMDSRWEVTTS
jgi:hypothetical protein